MMRQAKAMLTFVWSVNDLKLLSLKMSNSIYLPKQLKQTSAHESTTH